MITESKLLSLTKIRFQHFQEGRGDLAELRVLNKHVLRSSQVHLQVLTIHLREFYEFLSEMLDVR